MCNNCNLTCSYCYERQDNDNNPNCQISLLQARKAIDTLMKSINMHEYKKGGINFFGGEPLLCFDYIKELVLYSEAIKDPNVSIQYSMVTNGTLLTEEKIEFLEKYNFSGKKIILFATSGGSGFGNTARELQTSAPDSVITEGKIFHNVVKQQIAEWVGTL